MQFQSLIIHIAEPLAEFIVLLLQKDKVLDVRMLAKKLLVHIRFDEVVLEFLALVLHRRPGPVELGQVDLSLEHVDDDFALALCV